jgi:methylaspartate ammonia-lyase
VPIFAQSGDDRYLNVDKMILKGVDVLPHALINAVDGKLGRHGQDLLEYVGWLARRIQDLRPEPTYQPDLHIDVYGTIGLIFDHDPARIADYLGSLEKAAGPFRLYLEGPVDMGERERQMEALGQIRHCLDQRGCAVRIVADEWCNTHQDVVDFTDRKCCHMVQIKTPDLGSLHNTVQSVLYCRAHGMEAYQGGTCNETDGPSLRARGPGRRGRADAGQAGHGLRRGLHDGQQRDGTDPGAAAPAGPRLGLERLWIWHESTRSCRRRRSWATGSPSPPS